VSVTLPDDTLKALNRVDPDTGWAIVKLMDGARWRRASVRTVPDVALVQIASRRSLIVVSRAAFKALPGVNLIPLSDTRAFLAMDAGRGMSDLELAVIDRLADPAVLARERQALESLRSQLAAWRRDRSFTFHSRSIVVVERMSRRRGGAPRRSPA
jgi:hypothetical protein